MNKVGLIVLVVLAILLIVSVAGCVHPPAEEVENVIVNEYLT